MGPNRLNLVYHEAQNKIFFECEARRRVIPKGRRLGFTRGAAQAFCEYMLDDPGNYMWGDTVNANIDRYVDRYFMPVLKQLPRSWWDWKKQARELHIRDARCDFRSADKPENWEGFGYKKILLNEAGIILKNEYLWENAVQPMLLDFPDSVCIIGGTPKGKNLFNQLAQRGENAAHPDWVTMRFTTYDNPFLQKAEIDQLIEETHEDVVKQEIYGEFLDTTENQFIAQDVVDAAVKRELEEDEYIFRPLVMGVDVARYGDDQSVICVRQGLKLLWLKKYGKLSTMELAAQVAYLLEKYPIEACFVDEVGVGAGVLDRLHQLGFDKVFGVNVGMKAGEDKRYYNKRMECWAKMREWLENADIPNDRALRTDLVTPLFDHDNKDRWKLEKKEDMKKRGYNSPDCADSLSLTFAMPVIEQNIQGTLEPEVVPDY